MPDGNLSIINTKLLKASTHAEQIKKNATGHRAGAGTYDNARRIVELLDEVMKEDLHALRKEYEQFKIADGPEPNKSILADAAEEAVEELRG